MSQHLNAQKLTLLLFKGMFHVGMSDRHESQSRNEVTVCVVNDYDILEISAGTICDRQMTQCHINRYKRGINNPLGENFPNKTIVVRGVITQEDTDLSIRITTHNERLLPLVIKGSFVGGDVQNVSIGQKCRVRWDFREQATHAMQGMKFEIYDEHLQHLVTLVISLRFQIA